MKLTASAGLFNLNGVAGSSDYKASVRLMSDAILPNSPTASGTGVGKTITAGSNTTLTVDGSVAALLDRIGVKNEGDASGLGAEDNGLYVVTDAGDGSNPWVLTRATDFDAWTELPGAVVSVEIGAANAGTQWICNVAAGGTFESTAITFVVPANYGGSAEPFDVGDLTGTITLDLDDGERQFGQMSGNTTFAVPTGTPVECESEITLVIQTNAANDLDFAAGIKRASDSAATFPKTLTADKSYRLKLCYQGGYWCLLSLIGGYDETI